ncbi:hypothetical protein yinte0001_8460 [Yersinia intermedia ATCC 29909]|nr:hypothetical protein yinte0001_8460 [Yersinia intermedia ATCC 29909]
MVSALSNLPYQLLYQQNVQDVDKSYWNLVDEVMGLTC